MSATWESGNLMTVAPLLLLLSGRLRQRQNRKRIPVKMILADKTRPESRCRWTNPHPSRRLCRWVSIRYSMPLCRLLLVVSPPASRPRIAQAVCEGVLWRGHEGVVVVTGAAFAPSAIGVLDRAQPFAGAQNIRFAIAFARGLQSAQRQKRAVDVIDAPAPVPASIGFLRAFEIFDAAPEASDDSRTRRTRSEPPARVR